MSKQRSDARVLTDAARFNAVTRALRRLLRKDGIRNPRSSRKGREYIMAGATGRATTPGRG